MKAPWIWKRFAAAGWVKVLVVVVVLAGVAEGPAVRGTVAPPPVVKDPWFEAKNVCVFRLGNGPMPQTAGELSDALERGWSRAIVFPDPDSVVRVERAAFPSIGALRVNLSEGRLKHSAKDEGEIQLNNRVEREVRIGKLEVRGDPILVRDAKMHMHLNVEKARMVMERDQNGRPVMMLRDAGAGRVSFEVKVADIEGLMLADAQEGLARFGVDVDDVQLNVVSETPRSVQVTLRMAMEVGFVPAGITFKAHIAVDDEMNAKVTGMSLDGDEVLGPLIAQFMRAKVVQHNNESRPLVGFPEGKLKLRDVSFRADDSLHFEAEFGN